jgi:hypothetical protein
MTAAVQHEALARFEQVEDLGVRVARRRRREEQPFGPQARQARREQRRDAQANAPGERFKH